MLSGRLAPVLAPGDAARMFVRIVAIAIAVILWIFIMLPIYRRRVSGWVMALEGTLKDFSLADIFQLIGLQRKTGVLTSAHE